MGTIVGAIAKILEIRETSRGRSTTNQVQTKSHRWNYFIAVVSFCIGAFGFMVSLGTELVEQKQAKELAIRQLEDSQRTMEQFQRVLTKIETIGFGLKADLHLDAVSLANYRRALQSEIQTSLNKTGQERLDDEILRHLLEFPGFDPMASIDLGAYYKQSEMKFGGEFFEQMKNSKKAKGLIFPLPQVAFFKTPIVPLKFISEDDQSIKADLKLKYPSPIYSDHIFPIRLHLSWHVDPTKPFEFHDGSIEYPGRNIFPDRVGTNKILSLKDLEGSQMVIFISSEPSRIPSQDYLDKWNETIPTAINLTINEHPVDIDLTKLVTTRGRGQTVHSYIFPKPVDH